jgi:hypothetical protein
MLHQFQSQEAEPHTFNDKHLYPIPLLHIAALLFGDGSAERPHRAEATDRPVGEGAAPGALPPHRRCIDGCLTDCADETLVAQSAVYREFVTTASAEMVGTRSVRGRGRAALIRRGAAQNEGPQNAEHFRDQVCVSMSSHPSLPLCTSSARTRLGRLR